MCGRAIEATAGVQYRVGAVDTARVSIAISFINAGEMLI